MPTATFNPESLQVARQFRNITQSKLASAMGVSQALVSKLESGVLNASQSDLEKLSSVLRLPHVFFTRQRRPDGPASSEIYHRKRQRASAKKLNKIYADATLRRWAIEDLLQSVQEPPIFPSFPIEDYASPSETAQLVRSALRLPGGPIRNLAHVIERAGGIVMRCDFETRYVDGFSRRMTRDAKQVPPLFFLNDELAPDRWRFTLAHELGHIVMHGETNPHMEEQANEFAAEFLMPKHEIKGELWNLTMDKLPGLKIHWGVSMVALVKRSTDLGMVSERKARSLYVKLRKLGYATMEPPELDPPTETPEQFPKLLRFFNEKLEYTRAELQQALAIGADILDDWSPIPESEDTPYLTLVP